jgi:hypothetical protein
MMLRLQAEVKEQESAKRIPTQALQEELTLAATELDDNVVEIGAAREREPATDE